MGEPRGDLAVQFADRGELAALDARLRLERLDVGDRVGAGPEDRTLVGGRQEPVVEAVRPADRHLAAVQDDETRQVVALTAKPVGDPRAHARLALLARAGVEEIVRGRVLGKRRGHRPDHRDVVHPVADVREQVADRRAARAAGPELPRRGEGLAVVVELGRLRLHLERLAVLPLQPRLGIEGIHLRGPALHEQEDDAPGLRRVVRRPAGGGVTRPGRRCIGTVEPVGQEGGEGHRAESAGAAPEHLAAGRRWAGESSAVVHDWFRTRAATRSGAWPPGHFRKMNSLTLMRTWARSVHTRSSSSRC